MIQEIHSPGDPVADILFNWLPLIGALAIAGFGLLIIIRGYRLFLNSTYLKRHGQPGRARVTKKWVSQNKSHFDRPDDRKPIDRHFLQYQLLTDRRAFSVEEVAPIDLWNQVEPGEVVDVIYHPRRPLMRLAAWGNHNVARGGAMQMAMGAIALSAAVATILSGTFGAMSAPAQRDIGAGWLPDKAKVLNMGSPSDPYLRVFAPDAKMIRVVFGETQGGAMLGNERILRVSAEQIETHNVAEGATLKAWIDPDNEYNAILELERPDRPFR